MDELLQKCLADIHHKMQSNCQMTYRLTDEIFRLDIDFAREYGRYKLAKSQKLAKYLLSIIQKLRKGIVSSLQDEIEIYFIVGGAEGLRDLGLAAPTYQIPGQLPFQNFPTHRVPTFPQLIEKHSAYLKKKSPELYQRLRDQPYQEDWLRIPEQYSLPGEETFFEKYTLPFQFDGHDLCFIGNNHELPIVYYEFHLRRMRRKSCPLPVIEEVPLGDPLEYRSSLDEGITFEENPHYSAPPERWGEWIYNPNSIDSKTEFSNSV